MKKYLFTIKDKDGYDDPASYIIEARDSNDAREHFCQKCFPLFPILDYSAVTNFASSCDLEVIMVELDSCKTL